MKLKDKVALIIGGATGIGFVTIDGMQMRVPLGRAGQPADIANAFLASDEASHLTSQILRVDGGIVIGT
ncbi:MAG: SDR family oxidoreductase [Chloroflexota bacterium]